MLNFIEQLFMEGENAMKEIISFIKFVILLVLFTSFALVVLILLLFHHYL